MIRADHEAESQPQHSGAQVSVFFYDDATVFGIAGTDETIVRYDLPARGITEDGRYLPCWNRLRRWLKKNGHKSM